MLRFYRIYAKYLFGKGEFQKALVIYERIVKDSKTSRDRLSLARIYLKTGRFDDAEAQLRKLNLVDLNQTEVVQAKLNLAQVVWKKGDVKDAIRRAEVVFATEKITLVYATLGYLYIEAGDLKKALAFNQEAYEYNSANSEICDNLAECWLALKEYQKALDLLVAISKQKIVPTFPEWRYHYGLALEGLGQHDEALAQLKIALAARFSALSAISPEKVQKAVDRVEAAKAAAAKAEVGPGA
jgi:tetratricopeptide (TPR) repeat protein